MHARRTAIALTATATAAMGAVAVGVMARRRTATPTVPVRTGTFPNGVGYAALGTGPRTILFLPGGPGVAPWEKSPARAFLPAYATGEFTVWWLARVRDMPTGYSVADMADDVAGVIAELGGRVDAVVGASYGGLIALYLAARHPESVGRIALLGSTAVIPDATKALDRRFGEALGNNRFTEAAEAGLEEMPVSSPLLRRLLAPIVGRMLASKDVNGPDVLVEMEAEMAYDARPILPQVTAPVLIVAGTGDVLLPREAIEETAQGLRDCTVIWHDGANHIRTIKGKRTAGEVLDFLRQDRT